MDLKAIEQLLRAHKSGELDTTTAAREISALHFEDIGHARVDHARAARQGFPEVVFGAGKTRAQPYYANAMDLRLSENYGQLRAADADGKPLPKVYVKVYARLADGSVKFHKDGYTDVRGRFDYASVNTPERQPIQRFSVLVLSEDRGAVIREAGPPPQ